MPSEKDGGHLDWAAYIKSQHHHLQLQMRATPRARDESNNNDNDNNNSNITADEAELRQWREVLRSPSEHQRLEAYARAMHSLATRYWEAPAVSSSSSGGESGSHDNNNNHSQNETPVVREDFQEVHEPTVGTKRSRPDSDDKDDAHNKRNATAGTSGDAADADAQQQEGRRYNDRVQCTLDCLQSYFVGEAHNSSSSSGSSSEGPAPVFKTLPLIFSRALKPLRREFFTRHGRMATACEVEAMLTRSSSSISSTSGELPEFSAYEVSRHGPHSAWLKAMHYMDTAAKSRHHNATAAAAAATATASSPRIIKPEPLVVLDVGSCYGPFYNKTIAHGGGALGDVPLSVDAMDLHPYRSHTHAASKGNYVWRGDWVSVEFFTTPIHNNSTNERSSSSGVGSMREEDDNNEEEEEAAEGRLRVSPTTSSDGSSNSGVVVRRVQAACYDAVVFCLLLSYLPSPRLRFRAVLHAFLALKEGGLLVVISTRTQGSRKANWVSEWSEALASVGLARVHQQMREKIVILSFERRTLAEDAADLQAGMFGDWIHRKMQSKHAEEGLRIMADM